MERGDASDQPLSELEKEAELKRSTKPMFPPALDPDRYFSANSDVILFYKKIYYI